MTALFMGGHWEWLVILVIALLLFGHRIPGMARSLGSGITEFKKGLKKGEGEQEDAETKALPHQDQSSVAQQGQKEKTTHGG